MFVMLAVASSMVLASCGGDDAKEGGAMSVCDCVKAEKEYLQERSSARGDEGKMKEIDEKFKSKKDQCEKMMKDASEEDQKKMMEEARNCK